MLRIFYFSDFFHQLVTTNDYDIMKIVCCRLRRHQHRARRGRRDRRAQAAVRHLGQRRQCGLTHGLHRRRRSYPGT